MDKKEFSAVKRAESFTHAGRGVILFAKTAHNAWVQGGIFIMVIFLGMYYQISSIEWGMIMLVSGLVFASEAINPAIEVDIDLTSPAYHPFARDTKDIAAGAVLISCLTALIVGLCIFGPHLL